MVKVDFLEKFRDLLEKVLTLVIPGSIEYASVTSMINVLGVAEKLILAAEADIPVAGHMIVMVQELMLMQDQVVLM